MKNTLLVIFIVTNTILCQGQHIADSTIIIQDQQLYTIPKPENLDIKGQIDAAKYYKKYKAAATGTLITSLVSPIVGLVPAILCSATEPKIENLGYPNEELFRQPEYNKSYTRKAKKIKQRKVWSNWGVAFGINLLVVLIIAN